MFTFADAIEALQQGATVFNLANQARPGANYRFAEILPEIGRASYRAKTATMRIRATMAGMVGMSSPYPSGGARDTSRFDEATIKLANDIRMEEEDIREIQEFLRNLQINSGATNEAAIEQVLNFMDKVVIQPHLDTAEWLRGQALLTGAIDWTFNGIHVEVDYGIPAGNLLSQETGSNGWGGSTSKFWDNIRQLKSLLKQDVVGFWAHPDTIDMIVSNPANNLYISAQNTLTGQVTLNRYVSVLSVPALSTDVRDTITLIPHGDEAEVYDLTALPLKQTKNVLFFPKGAILAIGRPRRNQWIVGAGSTPEPTIVQLGYTHLAPCVESGGTVPGRWARAFTPENQPWQLAGQGASNLLPVIEDPKRIAVASSVMS
jgi:hypothetical protein